MPPTIPIVSAFAFASDSLTSLRPKAVPAALSSPSRIAAMPTATSQPKKAAPQLSPPYSARWRARTSRTVSRVVGAAVNRAVLDHSVAVCVARPRGGRHAVALVDVVVAAI